MQSTYRFSIFTATYNRAHLLSALYECIKAQTYRHDDFEWVIVSDGSTDDTPALVQSFIDEGAVNIQFVNKENGGKHTAWRAATRIFRGRYVVTADDDDPVTPDMLSVFDKHWKELEASPEYNRFWEVRARAQYEDGRLVGMELPAPYFDSDYIELNYALKMGAEMVGCRKVEILRNEAAVPEKVLFDGKCSNYSEALRWTAAARKYRTRFISEVTRTYVIGHDSLCVSVKGQAVPSKKKYNTLVSGIYTLNTMSDILLKYSLKDYLTNILQVSYSSIRVKEPVLGLITHPSNKILVAMAYLPALLIYMFRR